MFALDRDLETGKIRGAVCTMCNQVLQHVRKIPGPHVTRLAAYEESGCHWGKGISDVLYGRSKTARPPSAIVEDCRRGKRVDAYERRQVMYELWLRSGQPMNVKRAAQLFKTTAAIIRQDYQKLGIR